MSIIIDGTNGITMNGSLTEDVFTITDSTSVAIDPTNGTIQLWTLGASRTPTVANFNSGESVTLMISSGAYAITWTSVPVTWVTGTAPTLSTPGYNVIELWKAGSVIYGASIGLAA
jgi:hypothetical protein